MKPKMEEEEEVFEEEEELDDKDDIRDFDEPGDLDPGDLDQPMIGEEPSIAVAGKRFVLCCQICFKRVLLHQQVLRAQFFVNLIVHDVEILIIFFSTLVA